MMHETIVSIIVPVYNAEKYLPNCLDSILNQSFKQIEIIVVNDGSTDKSREIILEYSLKDPRVLLIDSPNRGVSSARNIGLRHAKGNYIGFVDSDDYIEPEMYKKLIDAVDGKLNALVVCNAYTVDSLNNLSPRLGLDNEILKADNAEMLSDMLKFRFDYANWNKLYSTHLIKDRNISFNEKMYIWEDLLFNLMYMEFADNIITVPARLYYYRVHNTSIMTTSQKNLGEQYNHLYFSYQDFCRLNDFTKQEKIFTNDRKETCINNILYFFQVPINKIPFFKRLKGFSQELQKVSPIIYLHDGVSKKFTFLEKLLLRSGAIKSFATLLFTKRFVKEKMRKIFKVNLG